ncbi:MAG: phosphoserine aminotransferase [Candidatus Hydrogenedentota bacterium]
MEQRVFNFSAGPGGLPLAALEEAQRNLLVLPGAGASVMEISHRGKEYMAVHAQAIANIKSLLNVPDNYKILFMQGGATLQFAAIAMNFLKGGSADYIHTGAWAKKAIGEGKKFGVASVVWDNKPDNYNRCPKQDELKLDANAAYLHFTSNETIGGVEFQTEPDSGAVPLFCDASSDILSKPLDIAKYGLLYAGAQKNMGPAGVALVIIREDLLEKCPDSIPDVLNYKLTAENDSMLNTPPCFAIYMVMLTTKWLINDIGGLDKMLELNRKKAKLIYDVIDGSNGFYKGHAVPEYRSLMNVTFTLPDEALEKAFIDGATKAGMHGLKGHRSVGGCRASIYNAMPLAGAETLASYMKDYAQAKG